MDQKPLWDYILEADSIQEFASLISPRFTSDENNFELCSKIIVRIIQAEILNKNSNFEEVYFLILVSPIKGKSWVIRRNYRDFLYLINNIPYKNDWEKNLVSFLLIILKIMTFHSNHKIE